MADQLEFANVIIINKTDVIPPSTLGRITRCIASLNPSAKILNTRFGRVDPAELVGTRSFNLEAAQMSSGWLASLHEMFLMDVNGRKTLAPKPETLEYGIGSFVYRARRPFDPMRLYRLLAGKFVLIQPDPDEEGEDDEEDGEDEDTERGSAASAVQSQVWRDRRDSFEWHGAGPICSRGFFSQLTATHDTRGGKRDGTDSKPALFPF